MRSRSGGDSSRSTITRRIRRPRRFFGESHCFFRLFHEKVPWFSPFLCSNSSKNNTGGISGHADKCMNPTCRITRDRAKGIPSDRNPRTAARPACVFFQKECQVIVPGFILGGLAGFPFISAWRAIESGHGPIVRRFCSLKNAEDRKKPISCLIYSFFVLLYHHDSARISWKERENGKKTCRKCFGSNRGCSP